MENISCMETVIFTININVVKWLVENSQEKIKKFGKWLEIRVFHAEFQSRQTNSPTFAELAPQNLPTPFRKLTKYNNQNEHNNLKSNIERQIRCGIYPHGDWHRPISCRKMNQGSVSTKSTFKNIIKIKAIYVGKKNHK